MLSTLIIFSVIPRLAAVNVYKTVTWHLAVNALKCHLPTSLQQAVLGVPFLMKEEAMEEEALFLHQHFPSWCNVGGDVTVNKVEWSISSLSILEKPNDFSNEESTMGSKWLYPVFSPLLHLLLSSGYTNNYFETLKSEYHERFSCGTTDTQGFLGLDCI